MVINQLIAPRELLVKALEGRFKRVDELKSQGRSEESIIKYFGDIGRYENLLGVPKEPTDTFMCTNPSIVFTHPKAFGYEFNHGKKKRLGDLRIIEIPYWGRAKDVLELYTKSFEQIEEDKTERCYECGSLYGEDHKDSCEAGAK